MTKPLHPWVKQSQEDLPFHAANKNGLGEWALQRIVVPSLRRMFGGIYVYIHPATLRLRSPVESPVIFCLTHSGWWDGHIAYMLNQKIFKHDGYLMMEEVHLARYAFFTWVGVFGIDRHDARKAIASIEYITGLLKETPNSTLWMFPQGTMTHPEVRPLDVFGGAANIARRVGRCAVVPVALRYDFLMEQRPDAFARLGPPIFLGEERVSSRELTVRISQAMTQTADELRGDVLSRDTSSYRRLIAGKGSINRVWDRVVKMVKREN